MVNLNEWWRSIDSRFLTLICLVIVGVVGVVVHGAQGTILQLLVGALLGAGLDSIVQQVRRRKWVMPVDGFIFGLTTALLLPLGQPIAVTIATTLSILFKYTLTVQDEIIFNPAALGVVLVARWGGLTLADWGESIVMVTIVLGLISVIKANRLPSASIILISYGIGLYLTRLNINFGQTTAIAQTIRDLPWFVAFFVAPEPNTSVKPFPQQLLFGITVAMTSIGYMFTPLRDFTIYYGLFTANLFAVFARTQTVSIPKSKIIPIQK